MLEKCNAKLFSEVKIRRKSLRFFHIFLKILKNFKIFRVFFCKFFHEKSTGGTTFYYFDFGSHYRSVGGRGGNSHPLREYADGETEICLRSLNGSKHKILGTNHDTPHSNRKIRNKRFQHSFHLQNEPFFLLSVLNRGLHLKFMNGFKVFRSCDFCGTYFRPVQGFLLVCIGVKHGSPDFLESVGKRFRSC